MGIPIAWLVTALGHDFSVVGDQEHGHYAWECGCTADGTDDDVAVRWCSDHDYSEKLPRMR